MGSSNLRARYGESTGILPSSSAVFPLALIVVLNFGLSDAIISPSRTTTPLLFHRYEAFRTSIAGYICIIFGVMRTMTSSPSVVDSTENSIPLQSTVTSV